MRKGVVMCIRSFYISVHYISVHTLRLIIFGLLDSWTNKNELSANSRISSHGQILQLGSG